MEKYVPSHQFDIILYATFTYDEYGNYVYNDSLFKGKMFTSSLSQNKNDLKNMYRNQGENINDTLKNFLKSISSKNYDDNDFKDKLSNMKRNKAYIQNENAKDKNNPNKRRNRYRSILVVNKKDILDFEKNLNIKKIIIILVIIINLII